MCQESNKNPKILLEHLSTFFHFFSPDLQEKYILPSTTGGPMYRQGATVMKGSIPVSKHRLQRIGTRTNEDLLAEHSKVGIRLKSNDL